MKPIKFPRDGQAHDKIVEWWYFNGHLQSAAGGRYAFMDCLFKVDARRIKLPLLAAPFRQVYFSHSLLSDIKRQKFYPEIDYLS
ncbi:MAG TPA: lipocalin-like domain-containing protein, partial [Candidatus Methylomirabilis sp.]|nr:lipocalin-like domain-containing protein [Candidatus Methylomirabilis sp.]